MAGCGRKLPLAVKRWYAGQHQSVRQHTVLTDCRTISASNGFADTFCSLLAYAKLTFVLGWTAPNGIAMCHDEVVASLI